MSSPVAIAELHFDFGAVGQMLLEELYTLLARLPLFAAALAIVWVCWILGGWLAHRFDFHRVAGHNPFLQDLLRTTLRATVVLVGVLVALEIMQATAIVGAVLGTAGVLGVAIGFAFKDILENYLAGILMSLRQPFRPHDYVDIDGNEGVVIALNSRATVLMTLDGNHLRLPNALVFRSVILNYTRNPNRRFQFGVGIGVQEDLVLAQKLGTDELTAIPGVLADPPPRALIVGLGDSNVQMRYFGWVDQNAHDFLAVQSEAIRRVKLKLESVGMDMPEPIYRVQLTGSTPGEMRAQPAAKEAAKQAASSRLEGTDSGTAADTRARRDLEGQLDIGSNGKSGDDLLDPTAPHE